MTAPAHCARMGLVALAGVMVGNTRGYGSANVSRLLRRRLQPESMETRTSRATRLNFCPLCCRAQRPLSMCKRGTVNYENYFVEL